MMNEVMRALLNRKEMNPMLLVHVLSQAVDAAQQLPWSAQVSCSMGLTLNPWFWLCCWDLKTQQVFKRVLAL